MVPIAWPVNNNTCIITNDIMQIIEIRHVPNNDIDTNFDILCKVWHYALYLWHDMYYKHPKIIVHLPLHILAVYKKIDLWRWMVHARQYTWSKRKLGYVNKTHRFKFIWIDTAEVVITNVYGIIHDRYDIKDVDVQIFSDVNLDTACVFVLDTNYIAKLGLDKFTQINVNVIQNLLKKTCPEFEPFTVGCIDDAIVNICNTYRQFLFPPGDVYKCMKNVRDNFVAAWLMHI